MNSHVYTGNDKPAPNNRLKAIGTVFALLIAPIIAGIIANIGSFVVQKKLEDPAKPEVATAPPAPSPATVVDKPVAQVAAVPAAAAIAGDRGAIGPVSACRSSAPSRSTPTVLMGHGKATG
jgi:phosphate/sulfate permease